MRGERSRYSNEERRCLRLPPRARRRLLRARRWLHRARWLGRADVRRRLGWRPRLGPRVRRQRVGRWGLAAALQRPARRQLRRSQRGRAGQLEPDLPGGPVPRPAAGCWCRAAGRGLPEPQHAPRLRRGDGAAHLERQPMLAAGLRHPLT